jgi:hypothetical protein
MKLYTTTLLFTLIVSFSNVFSQDIVKQCKKAKFDAQQSRLRAKEFASDQSLALHQYKMEFSFYLKAEKICGNIKMNNLKILFRSYQSIKKLDKDKPTIALYSDSLVSVFERAQNNGLAIDSSYYEKIAKWYAKGSKPDHKKAEINYLKSQSFSKYKPSIYNITGYYGSLYDLFVENKGEDKELKSKLIGEFFRMSSIINDNDIDVKALDFITKRFNRVIRSCDDILPELSGYLSKLPQDKNSKILAVNNFIELLENKKCTSSPEYETLIDTLLNIDRSPLSVLAKVKLLRAKGKHNDAQKMLNEAKKMEMSEDQKKIVLSKIADMEIESVKRYFNNRSYKKAFSEGRKITGKYRGEGLKLAGNSVAALANSCGSSTFERKCNYYYAIQVLESARSAGASVSASISKCRSLLPTSDEKFDNGNPSTMTLSCWGVTVSLK